MGYNLKCHIRCTIFYTHCSADTMTNTDKSLDSYCQKVYFKTLTYVTQ